jgi:stage IV sporulation protein FB
MLIRIDLKIFVLGLIFCLTKQIELYALIMLFCLLHELGHIFGGLIVKTKPRKLEINPMGLSVAFEFNEKDCNKKIKKANMIELKKIFIAFCGPLTNLILIILFVFFNINIVSRDIAIYSNILIILFNLFPIYPLDGGRILKSIIHIFYGEEIAQVVINKVTNSFMVLLTLVGSIGVFYFENLAIFLIIVFLWILVYNENNKYEKIKEKV